MAAVALVGSKRFSVVEFVDENMVEAIPTCWVDDLNSAAWWPRGLNSGQLSKAITNCTQPDDSAGDRFLIRVLGQAGYVISVDDYSMARKMADKGQFMSDVECAGEGGSGARHRKRDRRPPTRFDDDSATNDSEDTTRSPPSKRAVQIPVSASRVPPAKRTAQLAGCTPTSQRPVQLPAHTRVSDVLHPTESQNRGGLSGTGRVSTIHSTAEFQRRVLKTLEGLHYDQRSIQKQLNETHHLVEQLVAGGGVLRLSADGSTAAASQLPYQLPMATENDITVAEVTLKEAAARNDMIAILSRIGGSSLRAHIYNIMKRVLRKELAVQYSYLGRKGKKKFASLQLSQVVVSAVLSTYPNASEYEISQTIGRYLAQVSDREGGRKARMTEVASIVAPEDGSFNTSE